MKIEIEIKDLPMRCEDCKHYNKERKWCNWLSEMYDQGEEWFCADGEKR